MKKELDFLKKYDNGFLATVDEAGKPKVRGWGILRVDDNKLVFGTSESKKVFSQLKENPVAEWISMSENYTTLRANGRVRFEDDNSVKERIRQEDPLLQKIFASSDEGLQIFYLEELEFKWYTTEIPAELQDNQ